MKEILIYIGQVLAGSGILLLVYHFVVAGKTTFKAERAFIILAMLIPAVIPLFKIPVYAAQIVTYSPIPVELGYLSDESTVTVVEKAAINPLLLVYFIFTGSGIGVLIYHILRIQTFKRGAKITRTNFYTLFENSIIKSPFSFFRNLFVGENIPSSDLERIITHELSHIRHKHSQELLLAELIKTLLWWNPFVWMLRRRLIEVHEYQADRDVVDRGYDAVDYQNLIFKQLFGCLPEMTSGLNNSLTKKRFIMMTKQTNSSRSLFRMAAIIPVACMLLALFSFTKKATVYVEQKDPKVAVNKSSSSEDHVVNIKLSEREIIVDGLRTTQNDEHPVTVISNDSKVKIVTVNTQVMNSDKNDITLGDITGFNSGGDRKVVVDQNVQLINKDGKQPLIIVDGKEVPYSEINKVSPNNTHSISVLKDDAATKQYGEKGKDGVILITSKEYAEKHNLKQEPSQRIIQTVMKIDGVDSNDKPLVIYNGKELGKISPNELDPKHIHSVSVLKAEAATKQYGEKGKDGVIIITGKNNNQVEGTTLKEFTLTSYVSADSQSTPQTEQTLPQFPGGEAEMKKWLAKILKYPQEAIDDGIQGKVVVRFRVETDGAITNTEIVSSPDKHLSNEAIRIVNAMPNWVPGKADGKPVATMFTFPINFAMDIQTNGVEILDFCEQMPQFPGGQQELSKFIAGNLKYPEDAFKKGIEGRIVTSFYVDTDGSIKGVRIYNSSNPLLAEEALRVVNAMPQWIPGMQDGKKVAVKFILPVVFKLDKLAPSK